MNHWLPCEETALPTINHLPNNLLAEPLQPFPKTTTGTAIQKRKYTMRVVFRGQGLMWSPQQQFTLFTPLVHPEMLENVLHLNFSILRYVCTMYCILHLQGAAKFNEQTLSQVSSASLDN
jgi:hypothetical protein